MMCFAHFPAANVSVLEICASRGGRLGVQGGRGVSAAATKINQLKAL